MILLANDLPTLRNQDKNRILGLNEHTDAPALQNSIYPTFFHARFNRSRIDKMALGRLQKRFKIVHQASPRWIISSYYYQIPMGSQSPIPIPNVGIISNSK